MKIKKYFTLFTLLGVGLLSQAATCNWNGTGTWGTVANWSPSVPTSADDVVVQSGTLTLDANINYNATMTITVNSGASMDVTENVAIKNTINNGSLSVTGASGALSVYGTLTNNGSITNNKTISAFYVVNNSGKTLLNNSYLAAGVSFTNYGTLTTTSDFSAATFNHFSGSLNLSGTVSITTLNNYTNITLNHNYFASTAINNIGGTVTVSGTRSLVGNFTNSGGGTLDIPSSAALTLANFTNSSFVIVRSPLSLAASGSLIITGSHSNSGTETFERYIDCPQCLTVNDKYWHQMASPVTSVSHSSAFGSYRGLTYNESSNTWTEIAPLSQNWSTGDGFLVTLGQSGDHSYVVDFSGTYFKGAYSKSVSNSDGAGIIKGYSLIGNPYTSYIDLEALVLSSVDNTFWIWNGVSYSTYQLGGASANGGVRYVSPGQSFFVHANAAGSVDFAGSQTHTKVAFKAGEDKEYLRIKMSGKRYDDEVVLTTSTRANDGYKFLTSNKEVPQIYLKKNEVKYAIYNLDAKDSILPLCFSTDSIGKFKLKVSEIFTHKKAILRDKKTKKEVELTQDSEVEITREKGDVVDRFELVLKSGQETTNLGDVDTNSPFTVTAIDGGMTISINNGVSTDVVVTNILGSVISSTTITNSVTIPVVSGSYFVSAVQSELTKTIRVNIK